MRKFIQGVTRLQWIFFVSVIFGNIAWWAIGSGSRAGDFELPASEACHKATSDALIIQSNAVTDAYIESQKSIQRAIRSDKADPNDADTVATEAKVAALYAAARDKSTKLYRSGCKPGQNITVDIASLVKDLCNFSKSIVKAGESTFCVLKRE